MGLIILWIILGLIGAGLLFFLILTFAISAKQFKKQLVRKDKNTWTRGCSWMENEEQVEMFRRGEVWGDAHKDKMIDVHIVNDGLNLYGEYFDFGYDRAVIIIPGRMEGCHYSHYFSKPYADAGYNVLCIDNRAHGLSDGKYNCLGLKEYRDVLAWGRMLREEYHAREIVLHGICIGAATAIHTMTAPEVPDYFTAIVADGMYKSFAESFKNHILERHSSTFPVQQESMLLVRMFCGVDCVHNGPHYCIDRLEKPILMMYSKEDAYSTPKDAQAMFDKCRAPKRLVWFEHGFHSHLRINDEERYDTSIQSFLTDIKSGALCG